MIADEDWDRVRRHVYARTNYHCEACGVDTRDPAAATRIEAHERWHYNAARGVQTLCRLVALCRECHEATHMGLADVEGRGEAARAHLGRVARMTPTQVKAHVAAAYETWEARSMQEWTPDLSLLQRSGIAVQGAQRAARGPPARRWGYNPFEEADHVAECWAEDVLYSEEALAEAAAEAEVDAQYDGDASQDDRACYQGRRHADVQADEGHAQLERRERRGRRSHTPTEEVAGQGRQLRKRAKKGEKGKQEEKVAGRTRSKRTGGD
jgi:hypothetical protein